MIPSASRITPLSDPICAWVRMGEFGEGIQAVFPELQSRLSDMFSRSFDTIDDVTAFAADFAALFQGPVALSAASSTPASGEACSDAGGDPGSSLADGLTAAVADPSADVLADEVGEESVESDAGGDDGEAGGDKASGGGFSFKRDVLDQLDPQALVGLLRRLPVRQPCLARDNLHAAKHPPVSDD